ncbi:unnamed protein product [Acanthoscelides obtectus]|uniref:Uncharacterized protein n=1 Tax=Acanthoscelides obtectus TaxID=200917 RepID=A0A9P0M3J5_ACAOB|nr:unnamed protein product [Acanthoscelides obtectus]CAK1624189.1 hypothetical protein AOBTE_LOCUS2385 [Acanthoscelides obtectus]
MNNLENSVESDLLKSIKLNYFDIQLGESTDNSIQDVLFAKPLETYTTGAAIFNLINDYLEKHQLVYGAKSMTGTYSGTNKEDQREYRMDSLLYSEASIELSSTFSEAVKVVIFIVPCYKFSSILEHCEDLGSLHVSLLLHT